MINKNILYSLKLNYKSWIAFFISIILLSNDKILLAIINFIIFFVFSYLLHYILHINNIYPFNAIHLYHHSHNNWFGFITELLYEFVLSSGFTFLKIYVCLNEYFIHLPMLKNIILKINIPLNILISLCYITIHNYNYSKLHINNIHELHHKNTKKNIFPDICDIIFNTKYNKKYINYCEKSINVNNKNIKDKKLNKKNKKSNKKNKKSNKKLNKKNKKSNKKLNKKNKKSNKDSNDLIHSIENTDHYIPNIFISTIIILFFINISKNNFYKHILNNIFYYTYIVSIIILMISTLIIVNINYNESINSKVNH